MHEIAHHNGLEDFWSYGREDTAVIIQSDLLIYDIHLVWIWSAVATTTQMVTEPNTDGQNTYTMKPGANSPNQTPGSYALAIIYTQLVQHLSLTGKGHAWRC